MSSAVSLVRRGTVVLVSVATAALGLAATPASADATAHVTGAVMSADGALEGVVVQAWTLGQHDWEQTPFGATTGQEGTYDLALPDGIYRVGFAVDGHVSEFWADTYDVDSAQDVVVGGADVPDIDAELEQSSSISGSVTDAAGDPAAGRVSVFRGDDVRALATVLTEPDGSYVVGDLPTGEYAVELEDLGSGLREFYADADSRGTADLVSIDTAGSEVGPVDESVDDEGVQDHLAVDALPAVAGQPRVGATVVADPGTWTPRGAAVTFGFQWARDLVDVPGATGRTYAITDIDRGHELSVLVTARARGYGDVQEYAFLDGQVTATPVVVPPVVVMPPVVLPPPVDAPPVVVPPVVVPPAVVALPGVTPLPTAVDHGHRPTVTGAKKVGSTLRAKVASWIPVGAVVSYQWLVDNRPVTRATASSFRVTARLRGTKVSVRVVATTPGRLPVAVVTKVGRITG